LDYDLLTYMHSFHQTTRRMRPRGYKSSCIVCKNNKNQIECLGGVINGNNTERVNRFIRVFGISGVNELAESVNQVVQVICALDVDDVGLATSVVEYLMSDISDIEKGVVSRLRVVYSVMHSTG
jgi:hypothetical protein